MFDSKHEIKIAIIWASVLIVFIILFNYHLYKLDTDKTYLKIKCVPVLPIFINDPRILENFGDGVYILENGFITECEAVE